MLQCLQITDLEAGGGSRGRRAGAGRIAAAKRAFTTRRATFDEDARLLRDGAPRSGDLVLAKVEELGQHSRLESPEGRRIQLYPGDEILVAYGRRYAPDQFEAIVPGDLGACDLVAAGGIAGKVLGKCAKVGRATRIRPVGLVADSSGPINLDRFALPVSAIGDRRPRVIVVAGTSMNSGKTTTAASLIRGLRLAGLRVAAAKVTGTGSGGDLWSMVDAGACSVLDFVDQGHSSTAGLAPEEVESTALSLIAHSARTEPDIVLVEVADGLLQPETAALLASPVFRDAIDGVVFAAGEAMGAVTGCDWLVRHGHIVLAVSGLVSASPLASREAETMIDVPVLTAELLQDPVEVPKIVFAGDGAAAAAA